MAWIELHQAARDHRKVVQVADDLDMIEAHVLGHLTFLWLWSLDNAPDGVLPLKFRVIARAAQWQGEPAIFVRSLIENGLIDESHGTLRIHDWDDYAGKLIEKRQSNARRNRELRARAHTDNITSASRDTHVTPHSTVQYRTQQNPTKTPSSEGVRAPEAKPKTPTKSKTTTRSCPLPDEWQPGKGVMRVAQELHLDESVMRAELDKFASHFRANGKAMADWDQAAMNWLRRSLEFGPAKVTPFQRGSPGSGRNGQMTAGDFADMARRLEAHEPGEVGA
jgi:hypothetical protein